jgi:hypothetical protein
MTIILAPILVTVGESGLSPGGRQGLQSVSSKSLFAARG